MSADNPFQIDHDNIDREWLRQPGLTRAAGRAEADARHDCATAKAGLDVLAARIRFEVIADPEAFGLPAGKKPTKDECDAAVTLDRRYQAALAGLNDLELDLGHLRADTTAMVDRRKALERYVELIALDYRAEREPAPLSDAARDRIRRGAVRPAGRDIDPDD